MEQPLRDAQLRWFSLLEVAQILGLGTCRRSRNKTAKRPLTDREKRVRPVRALIKSGALLAYNGRVREDWLADYQGRMANEARMHGNRKKLVENEPPIPISYHPKSQQPALVEANTSQSQDIPSG
jgi:hypothetical protein